MITEWGGWEQSGVERLGCGAQVQARCAGLASLSNRLLSSNLDVFDETGGRRDRGIVFAHAVQVELDRFTD